MAQTKCGSESPRLKIMVSSTVYGIEGLLDQAYGSLEGYGYEVWMSHAGTIPQDPRKHNFENCLDAVEQCDLFLGIITGRYGSRIAGQPSIVHKEVQRAVALDKLRWFLVNRDLAIARQVLKQFRRAGGWSIEIGRCAVFDDVRVIDLYEDAIQNDVALEQRTAHWAHEYHRDSDALRYIRAQFGDVDRIRRILDR
jgi:hypothetical protein